MTCGFCLHAMYSLVGERINEWSHRHTCHCTSLARVFKQTCRVVVKLREAIPGEMIVLNSERGINYEVRN